MSFNNVQLLSNSDKQFKIRVFVDRTLLLLCRFVLAFTVMDALELFDVGSVPAEDGNAGG